MDLTNISGSLQHPNIINEQIMEPETKQKHSETNRGYEQMDLTDIYKTFYPETKEHTSSQHLWNLFQNSPYKGSHNKPQQIQED